MANLVSRPSLLVAGSVQLTAGGKAPSLGVPTVAVTSPVTG